VLLLVVAGASCRREPPAPPAELERALARVVPPSGYAVSTPSYDAGTHSVSAVRDFEVDMDCAQYRAWLESQLGAEWSGADGGLDEVLLTKSTASDQYFLTVRCVRASRPARIVAVVQGVGN